MPKADDRTGDILLACIHGEVHKIEPSSFGISDTADGFCVLQVIATMMLVFASEGRNKHLSGMVVNYGEPTEWRLQLSPDHGEPVLSWEVAVRTDSIFTDQLKYGMSVSEWTAVVLEHQVTGSFPDVEVS